MSKKRSKKPQKPSVRMRKLRARFAVAFVVFAVLSSVTSYLLLTQHTDFRGLQNGLVPLLVGINLLFLLVLTIIIFRRIVRLVVARKKGSAGSRLHTRIVTMFSVVTIVPAIVVSVFSVMFFTMGVKSWFETKVSTALEESVAVAEAYLKEHKEGLRADVLAMAIDLNRESYWITTDPRMLNQFVSQQVVMRSLAEAIVFQPGRVLARSSLSFELAFEQIPEELITRAAAGEVVLITNESEDRMRALVRLEGFINSFLLVERFVDPRVIHHMEATHGAVAEYHDIQKQISHWERRFIFAFAVMVLILLLASIWYGMVFANKLVRPIGQLFNAAERVRAGDFRVKVKESSKQDELSEFTRAFNKMIQRLEQQREGIVEANRQLDARRRFTEAVLAGMSAGVIALDGNGCVTLSNRSAMQLLEMDVQQVQGRFLSMLVPEMEALLLSAQSKPGSVAQQDVEVRRGSAGRQVLNVRISSEERDGEITGYVVTFDDVTELLSAQRKAAWAGVARRIAHEIKNPLTPIQLSAERLKRKYAGQITEDRDTFIRYTDNITRNVGNIGKMVEEFVAFARMPQPVFAPEDIGAILRDVVAGERLAHPGITYRLALPDAPVMLQCDAGQMSQCLINILKNAAESLEEQGNILQEIALSVTSDTQIVHLEIQDTGPGFPEELMGKLTEPYMTTRAKGTGLGLAIVSKIIQDHHGTLTLANRSDGHGARVEITLPV
jgi:two-component system nitrogen regulation sensor histidine kinase NtrY